MLQTKSLLFDRNCTPLIPPSVWEGFNESDVGGQRVAGERRSTKRFSKIGREIERDGWTEEAREKERVREEGREPSYLTPL